ncbi:MAG: FtsX-like permease family protein [Clostridia bacterium]|nr:FtsX-like permease family protein [Clostridia bacterium]
MKIIVKHVLKNIKEKKIRSLIIVLSLIAVSIITMICVSMGDELEEKYVQTLRGVAGDVDLTVNVKQTTDVEKIGDKEDLSSTDGVSKLDLSKLNLPKDKVSVASIVSNPVKIEYKDDYKYALIQGFDLKEAVEMRTFKNNDIANLQENEIAITENTAKDLNVKVGEYVNVIKEDESKIALKVAIIAEKKGYFCQEANNINMLVCSKQTAQKILGFNENEVSSLFVKCNDSKQSKEIKDEIINSNKDYEVTVQEFIDAEMLEEATVSIMQIFILLLAIILVMVFFVISSLSKIIINERIPIIGTFRSIGATKTKMNLILVLENAIYGLVGGTIGAIIGANIKSSVSGIFFQAGDGIEIAKTNGTVPFIYIIAVIAIAVILQILMSLTAIIKNNRRPIKEIIFNTKTAKYKKSYVKTGLGIVLAILAVVLYKINTKGNAGIALGALMSATIALALEVPLVLSIFSKIFKFIADKLNMPVLSLASSNIKNNKSIINSSELIAVSLSCMLTLYMIISSTTAIFTAFEKTFKSDLLIEYPSYKIEEYEYIKDIENVDDIYPEYYASNVKINDSEKTDLIVVAKHGADKRLKFVDEFVVDEEKYNNLKYDEIILDELVLNKYDLKVGDTCKLTLNCKSEDKNCIIEQDVKIIASCDSTQFSTSRQTAIIDLELYKKAYGAVPSMILINIKDKGKVEDTLNELKNKVDDFGVTIETKTTYIDTQKSQVMSLISAFSALMGMGVILSFIGIINNQLISFMQRKREFAMLYSTSMSKKQLKRLITLETALSFGAMSIFALVVSYGMRFIADAGMKAMTICVPIIYDFKGLLLITLGVYVLMVFTSIAPKRKLRKMKVIDEIKYE